ncbi:MAG: Gfo/Idh/MocA family oxidoreductase [Candidatus Latescibacteria bacterium]|nr:Gfo/Idh/MocA family oxidoreductase [Candidatus Latescibacterota bacterium]
MFRVGLIGNRAHQMSYGPVLQRRPDCRIVAAAEHRPDKARPLEERFGVPCAADYDAVLENPDVDLVSIATDFYLKRPLIQKAIACGKHILVDKPLCRTVREAREILQAAQGARVKIVLSYPLRFEPALARLSQALRSGEYGRVVSYAHHSVRQFPDGDLMAYVSYPAPARLNGGGELMNLGSHAVDYLYSLFGPPRRVHARMERHFWEEYRAFGTEDMATLLCDYEGFSALLVTGRNKVPKEGPMVNAVDVTSEGRWVRVELQRGSYTVNGQPVDLPPAPVSSSAACVQHLIDCIVNDAAPQTGLQNGLAVTEIVTAAYQSAQTGGFIDLPLKDENHPLIAPDEQVIDGLLD